MSDPQEDELTADEPVSTRETPSGSKTEPTAQTRRQPPYHVIILNDEEHTFDYVIELLTRLFRHPHDVAEALTWQIHHSGRAVVYTTHREKAELKRDQVLEFGADPRMEISKGPLGCYIEPVPMD